MSSRRAGAFHVYVQACHPGESAPRCSLIFHSCIIEGVFKADRCFPLIVSEIVLGASRCYYFGLYFTVLPSKVSRNGLVAPLGMRHCPSQEYVAALAKLFRVIGGFSSRDHSPGRRFSYLAFSILLAFASLFRSPAGFPHRVRGYSCKDA